MAKKNDNASKANGSAVLEAEAPAQAADTAPAGNEAERAQPDQKTLDAIAEIRAKVQSNVGQVVLALMNLPRYRHQTLGDLMHVVLDPLMRDRIAIASAKAEGKEDTMAGIAIWATVSDEVDAKITEQVKAGAFPIRMSSEDWVSGETLWLLDVIAPSRKLATAVLANFRQISNERPVKVHPIVARSVDPEVIEKLRVKPSDAAPAEEA